MKNFTSPGTALALTAPAGDVVSGGAYLIGSLLVIATGDADEGDTFEGVPVGVFDVAKVADEVWTEALKIYFDESAALFTLDDDTASNPLVGVALAPVTATVEISSAALAADLLIDNDALTLQVLDYAQLGTDNAVVTIVIGGTTYTLTEGVDFTAAVSDDATATSLASAIDGLDGVAAAAVTDTVTVTPGTGATALDPSIGRVRLDGVAR